MHFKRRSGARVKQNRRPDIFKTKRVGRTSSLPFRASISKTQAVVSSSSIVNLPGASAIRCVVLDLGLWKVDEGNVWKVDDGNGSRHAKGSQIGPR